MGNTTTKPTSSHESSGDCPVPERYRNPAVFNVYNQQINDPSNPLPKTPLAKVQGLTELDPRNNMPVEPNQLPFPGQRKLLPTERQPSTIPKGGTDSTWLYPSQQMIFNSLKRKGKGEEISEDDMVGFILAHNTMNEMTWQRVAEWERLHEKECGNPALLRFRGRPDQMSPRAWFLTNILGEKGHFDRHDWYVDRCGKEVRYVIDFYFDEDKAGTPNAFEVDVRPALDSFENALDRVKMSIYVQFAKWGLPCPITGLEGSIGAAVVGGSRGSDSGGMGRGAAASAAVPVQEKGAAA